MTTSKFLHQDYGGTVTLFGSADKQMLFACTEGHYWIVEATEIGSATEDASDEPDAALVAGDRAEMIRRDFGDAAVSMLNL